MWRINSEIQEKHSRNVVNLKMADEMIAMDTYEMLKSASGE